MSSDESLVRELEQAVDAFAAGRLGTRRAREVRGMAGGFDRKVWREMAELGWLGILVPPQYGGLGLGLREMLAVARRLAGSILPEPLNACAVLAAQCLVASDNEALKMSLLPALCAGQSMPTLAWQEDVGQVDAQPVAVTATQEQGSYFLTGSKCCVPYAEVADGLIVTASSPDGVGLYWVTGNQGVTISCARLADASTQATVLLQRAPAQLLRTPSADLQFLDEALDAARLVAAGELHGTASACLQITLAYLRTRTQFGKPIGSFQGLQHRAVDLYLQQELCEAALTGALHQWDEAASPALRAAAASRAKARCSQAALKISHESIQMHGAIGWTDECDVGLYVKRTLLLSAWLGNATAHRSRYARLAPLKPKH